jgi:predicted DNA-binding transcriptional regulator AlpA
MRTIHVQLAVTLDEDAAKALAELLGPALCQALGLPGDDGSEGSGARLRASRKGLFAGQEPPGGQELLIDSKQAAKMLKVSEQTLWRMHHDGEMPPPIRIGRAVQWSLESLRHWVEEGCPTRRS